MYKLPVLLAHNRIHKPSIPYQRHLTARPRRLVFVLAASTHNSPNKNIYDQTITLTALYLIHIKSAESGRDPYAATWAICRSVWNEVSFGKVDERTRPLHATSAPGHSPIQPTAGSGVWCVSKERYAFTFTHCRRRKPPPKDDRRQPHTRLPKK